MFYTSCNEDYKGDVMNIADLKKPAKTTCAPHGLERITFPARIDALTAEILTEIAKENNISRNLLINAILEEFVENYTTN
jgi:predicted HicB family RNase H-like nuclease